MNPYNIKYYFLMKSHYEHHIYKNYHQIIALEDAILLDVLIPEYADKDCN
jgi:hypothetical protein